MIISLEHEDVVNAVRNHIRTLGFQVGEVEVQITKARSTGRVIATIDTATDVKAPGDDSPGPISFGDED